MIVTNNQGRFEPVANVFTDQSPFLEFSFARQLILNRSVHFTKSQRDNVQLVLDDFILKKKKGPFLSRGLQVSNFLRDHCLQLFQVISWRCTVPGCPFTATTKEGSIVEGRKPHSHPARSVGQKVSTLDPFPRPDLVVKKEVYARVRQLVRIGKDFVIILVDKKGEHGRECLFEWWHCSFPRARGSGRSTGT